MAWFPITDLSREDDIRMRRRRALMLLSALVFVPWIMFGGHGDRTRHPGRSGVPITTTPDRRHAGHADVVVATEGNDASGRGGESQTFAANSLRIDLPCARSVTVLPDPVLAGRAVLSVPAGAQGALDAISISNGSVSQQLDCVDDSPVTIRTGNVVPLTLVQSGENPMHAGSFDGAVTINSSGSGNVSVDHAGTLIVAGHASGDITVGSVTGPLTATLQGSGDLRVSGGTIPVLDATSHGSADLLLDRVQVLGGRVMLESSGDLRLGAVSGTFEATTEGSGDIVIDHADLDRLALRGSNSGDIMVRGGRVGTLDAERSGSGDLSVFADVRDGRVMHDGSGDVRIPAGGALVRTH